LVWLRQLHKGQARSKTVRTTKKWKANTELFDEGRI